MTIASEITKLNTNLTASYTACNNKGATIPSDQNFDNLATCIGSIPSGSTPTGTLSITANGMYDVTNYASANVSVSGSGNYTIISTTDIELQDTGEGSGGFSGDIFIDTVFYLILNNNTPVSFYTQSDVDGVRIANICDESSTPLPFSYILDTVYYDGSTFTVTCIGRSYEGAYPFFTLTANF